MALPRIPYRVSDISYVECKISQLAEIVKRLRAMTIKLLPVQVEMSQISDATSNIITPEVVKAFAQSGGDFAEAVPFWWD